jgi:myo-inositol-1(or 4)-monophosphatase
MPMRLRSWLSTRSTSGLSDDGPPEGIQPTVLEGWATAVATEAAAIVRRRVGRGVGVRTKTSPTDVVTATDLESESFIRGRLRALAPEAGILAEESGSTEAQAPMQWIVDPLDGTVNFLYSLPVFSVSIAAAVSGRVVAGAVADVRSGEVFSASLGRGATIDGRPLRVSTLRDLSSALVATGYSYRAEVRARQAAVLGRLLPRVRDVRSFGSAALQMCWVGAGRLDAYFERDIKPWDYAAGELVAREAGARTELPCPENEDLVLVSNPALFELLWSLVQLDGAS